MRKCFFFLTVFVSLTFSTNFCQAQYWIMKTFAGTGTFGSSGDNGPATAADLYTPSAVAVDRYGNIYIGDQNANRIRKVSTLGIITTVAGNGGSGGYSGDGGPADSALLYYPEGIAVDTSGNLYIADQNNNVIRKVTAATGIISTIAGNNTLGYTGDWGPATAAELYHPADVGVDDSGNVYFVDQDNSAMRKVSAETGIITTMAGTGSPGYNGDGIPATAAQLQFPQGIAVDGVGNVYIADFYNSRIRKVTAATGIITTVAGNGTGGYGGDGGPADSAEMWDASAVTIDKSGNIYISDYYNARIRKVDAVTGIMSTVAGNGSAGYSGDHGPADSAEIYYPQGVAVDTAGNIYIADYGNSRVRIVTDSMSSLSVPTVSISSWQVFPNPSSGNFTIQVNDGQKRYDVSIYNIIGEKVFQSSFYSSQTEVNLSDRPDGLYILYLTSVNGVYVDKIMLKH